MDGHGHSAALQEAKAEAAAHCDWRPDSPDTVIDDLSHECRENDKTSVPEEVCDWRGDSPELAVDDIRPLCVPIQQTSDHSIIQVNHTSEQPSSPLKVKNVKVEDKPDFPADSIDEAIQVAIESAHDALHAHDEAVYESLTPETLTAKKKSVKTISQNGDRIESPVMERATRDETTHGDVEPILRDAIESAHDIIHPQTHNIGTATIVRQSSNSKTHPAVKDPFQRAVGIVHDIMHADTEQPSLEDHCDNCERVISAVDQMLDVSEGDGHTKLKEKSGVEAEVIKPKLTEGHPFSEKEKAEREKELVHRLKIEIKEQRDKARREKKEEEKKAKDKREKDRRDQEKKAKAEKEQQRQEKKDREKRQKEDQERQYKEKKEVARRAKEDQKKRKILEKAKKRGASTSLDELPAHACSAAAAACASEQHDCAISSGTGTDLHRPSLKRSFGGGDMTYSPVPEDLRRQIRPSTSRFHGSEGAERQSQIAMEKYNRSMPLNECSRGCSRSHAGCESPPASRPSTPVQHFGLPRQLAARPRYIINPTTRR